MVKHGSQISEKSQKIDDINSVINNCNGGIDTNAANSARSKNQNNMDLENIVEEVKLQLQLQNKLYVTNAINEAEIRNTFNQILGKVARITNINKIVPNNGNTNGKPPPYMVELVDEK